MWLSNLSIVLPEQTLERASLRIEGDTIAEIIEGPAPTSSGTPRIDASGLFALPGIIDMHGDMIESELQPRPGVFFPVDMAVYELDKRLAASGVTTAYAAISFMEYRAQKGLRATERSQSVAAAINELRHTLLVDLHVHVRYEITTPVVAPAVADLLQSNHVQLLSLMDHTPGQGQYRDIEQYIENVSSWRKVHRSEVEAEAHERIRRAQDPAVMRAASDITQLARLQGIPLASHDDDTPDKVAAMADLGVGLCEFPVTLEAAQTAQRRGLQVVMGAPNVLRGGSHSGNLSARDAIEAGVVDVLASDYAPAALLRAVMLLAETGTLPLHAAARLVSQNPAAALGLHERGSIAPGKQADLVLVEGRTSPRVRGTIRRGVPIYWDGSLQR